MEPEPILANAARNLKPGGLALLSVANGYGWFELQHNHLNIRRHLRRYNLLRRMMGMKPYIRQDGERQQWFTKRRALQIAHNTAFRLIEEQNSNFIANGTEWDAWVADQLPSWAVSGWFFALHLR